VRLRALTLIIVSAAAAASVGVGVSSARADADVCNHVNGLYASPYPDPATSPTGTPTDPARCVVQSQVQDEPTPAAPLPTIAVHGSVVVANTPLPVSGSFSVAPHPTESPDNVALSSVTGDATSLMWAVGFLVFAASAGIVFSMVKIVRTGRA
jgi:long-subunit fatty acid transport protein